MIDLDALEVGARDGLLTRSDVVLALVAELREARRLDRERVARSAERTARLASSPPTRIEAVIAMVRTLLDERPSPWATEWEESLGKVIAALDGKGGDAYDGSTCADCRCNHSPFPEHRESLCCLTDPGGKWHDHPWRKRPLPHEIDGIPRRQRADHSVPVEKVLRTAARMVEEMGADERLTRAVNLLHEARECVADFVEGRSSMEK